MSDIAIKVEGLSKRYRIGANQQQSYKTLKGKLSSTAGAPFRAARHLFTGNGHGNGNGSGQNGKRNGIFAARPPRETIWALRDVSFEVKRGEVVGIIGRNGAGKSTLLKILSRITEPSEGYADIYGRVGSLLEVGTGFQPELSGRENIFLNGSILGMKNAEIKKKFDEIVAFSEVEKFIDTPVKYYSSGMYVRLAFAVAAHLDPEILIVDEVLSVGDAAFQKKCLGKMGDVATEGRTILFVSHNMNALESICSSAILLSDGRVAGQGKAGAVIKSYLGSEGTNEVHRRTSRQLRWIGISNRESLNDLKPDDNVTLLLEFESTSADMGFVHVDCAIFNERAENVIHTKSKFVSSGLGIPNDGRFTVEYTIQSPKLAPGSYYLTVYAYKDERELVWVDGIDAFHVTAKPYFGIGEYYDDVRSAILPEYTIAVRRS